jgi:hypothetical protein
MSESHRWLTEPTSKLEFGRWRQSRPSDRATLVAAIRIKATTPYFKENKGGPH